MKIDGELWIENEVEAELDGFSFEDDIKVAEWMGTAKAPGIVFVKTYAHGHRLSGLCGTPFVTGQLSTARKQEFVDRIRTGELPWVVATSALGTGVDIPCLRTVALAGVDAAPIGIIQASGRALRPQDNKEFEIVVFEPGTGQRNKTKRALGNLAAAGYPMDMPTALPSRGLGSGIEETSWWTRPSGIRENKTGYSEGSPAYMWATIKPTLVDSMWIVVIVGILLALTGNC